MTLEDFGLMSEDDVAKLRNMQVRSLRNERAAGPPIYA